MAIVPISGVAGVTGAAAAGRAAPAAAPGFADKIGNALASVADSERAADKAIVDVASGGSTSVTELMVATSKASLNIELAVQLRNKAVEAYQEIMRMQV